MPMEILYFGKNGACVCLEISIIFNMLRLLVPTDENDVLEDNDLVNALKLECRKFVTYYGGLEEFIGQDRTDNTSEFT
jgi:hypothetical protein